MSVCRLEACTSQDLELELDSTREVQARARLDSKNKVFRLARLESQTFELELDSTRKCLSSIRLET